MKPVYLVTAILFTIGLLFTLFVVTSCTSSFQEALNKAEQGDTEAQYNLGLCYYKGEGVAKDVVEAAKWYREAADQGYAEAQKALQPLGIER